MEQSGMDMAIDILKERLTDAGNIIKEQYKNVRPFRQEPMPERDSLYYYLNMTPEQRQMGEQSFGEAYTAYTQKMEQLRRKYNA